MSLNSCRVSLDLSHLLGSKYLTPEENHQVYGKCGREAGHGHRWTMSVTAELPVDVLNSAVDEAIMNAFDHRNLNSERSCSQMKGIVPTVENFVYVSACCLKKVLLERGLNPMVMKRFNVFETRTGSTEWDPTAEDIDRLSDDHAVIDGDSNENIRPIMSVTKRIEFWRDPTSVSPNIGEDTLWRCEGPGVGIPKKAKFIDIALRGRVNTRRGMVENLSNVKDIAIRLINELSKMNNKPENIIDTFDENILNVIAQMTRVHMKNMNIDPALLYKIHFETEDTTTSVHYKHGAAVRNTLSYIRELTWNVNDHPNIEPEQIVDRKIIEHATGVILRSIGEDPSREGLLDTPERYAKAMEFFASGYFMTPTKVLGDAVFTAESSGPVIVKDLDVYTHCEHHLVPFYGKLHVAYIPNGKVIGLSKIPRLVEVFARRLQIQEKLTDQVADCLMNVIGARGVLVVMTCKHMCMCSRGVQKVNSKTTTISKRGVYADNKDSLDEAFKLINV